MKNKPRTMARAARQAPLDHLRPGGRPRTEPEGSVGPRPKDVERTDGGETGGGQTRGETGGGETEDAAPAEQVTPGGGEADAVRGKTTRSPAAVATRPHLEGSEQGPS